MRIGIIGPGDVAQLHVPALRAAGANVVAVAAASENAAGEFARQWNIPHAVGDVARLADAELDAVVVSTPSPLHAAHTIAAIGAGLHVLCEIPLATSLKDAQEVVDTAKVKGAHVMVAQTLRYCAPFAELRRLVAEGDIVIEHIVSRRLLLRQRDEGWSGVARDWSDSVLWHHAGHQLDLLLWLLNISPEEAPAAVTGRLGRRWPKTGNAMDLSISVRAPDGRLATLALSYHSRVSAEDCIVITPDETFTIVDGSLLRNGDPVLVSGSDDEMKKRAIDAQDAEFVRAVVDGRQPQPAARDLLGLAKALSDIETRSQT